MPDFSVAIASLKKPIDELYQMAEGEMKAKLAVVRTLHRAKALHKKLYETQRVKTIWHTDRPLSLTSFFFPVQIVRNDPVPINPVRLKNLDPFVNNHNIIFGTVGQGKSILMRYLLGGEIKTGTRIPIFVELRNVDGKSLWQHISEKFCALLGSVYDDELFTLFASEGKISLLLDGFDEVEPGNVSRLMQEIEEISFGYPNCKIVLTSRPDSDCRHLTNFHLYKIQPLTLDDLVGFYKKITKDVAFSGRIHSAITSSPTKIKELITTPLLATLLAISYRSAQKIPLGFSEFYNELFQILLVRHDASKLGWRRHRKSKIDDRQIQQIFEAFCFSTRKKQLASVDFEMAYDMSVTSIQETGIDAEPQSFLDDIKKITCLLIEEGNKISFVHASVQEFFAARYIKTRTDVVARRFYGQVLDKKWNQWNEELNFLKQIDSHRALKYFYAPDCERSLDYILDGGGVTTQSVIKYLQSLTVIRKKIAPQGERFSVEKLRDDNQVFYGLHNLDAKIFARMFGFYSGTPNWNIGFVNDPASERRTYLEISQDRGDKFAGELLSYVGDMINDMVIDRDRMARLIERHEEASDFMDIS